MKSNLLHYLILIICISPTLIFAQPNNTTEDFNFTSKQIPVWELAKKRTIMVAQAMPEEEYNFKPIEGIKSFGQQMVHIANSLRSMKSRFILDETYSGTEGDASDFTKEEIISQLNSSFEEVIQLLRILDEAELHEEGKRHGEFPLTKWQSLLFMQDHVTNHRAKSVLYLRLKGIVPPAYGYN